MWIDQRCVDHLHQLHQYHPCTSLPVYLQTCELIKCQGTGTWSTKEIAERHVAAPAIAAAHQLRIISANRDERLDVVKALDMPQPGKSSHKVDGAFLQKVEKAVYGCILGAFIQGLEVSSDTTVLYEMLQKLT